MRIRVKIIPVSMPIVRIPLSLSALALVVTASAAACGSASEAKAEKPEPAKAAAQPLKSTPATPEPSRGRSTSPGRSDQPATPALARAVDYERLKDLLPDIDGWARSDTTGEQHTTPAAFARARAVYRTAESRIELVITDSAFSPMVLAPVSIFLAPGYSERSDDGFRRAVKVGGQPAVEQWNSGSRRAEVTALVANRYLVRASGDDVSGVEPVLAAVESVNLARLAALK